MSKNRLLGVYKGEAPGPLLLFNGGMHGNEPAGVRAIELLMKMLEVEHITNPEFKLMGTVVGLLGNRRAFAKKSRFIQRDMNRLFTEERLTKIRETPINKLRSEDRELSEWTSLVNDLIDQYGSDKTYFIDLHTTTAEGGIFTIPGFGAESLDLAHKLKAPVITGMLDGLRGTSLHYFGSKVFNNEIAAVCFESGQHNDPRSVNRAIAGMINVMRAVGAVNPKDIEHQHDRIIATYAQGLPKQSALKYAHSITKKDKFRMKPGYRNFQGIRKGEVLAEDRKGPIKAPLNGNILMPLYQKQGDDGFFIVQPEQETFKLTLNRNQ